MKFVVQRVKNAQVDIEGKTVGKVKDRSCGFRGYVYRNFYNGSGFK